MPPARPARRSSKKQTASMERFEPLRVDHERFEHVVRRIPRGRVATYGQIAALAGLPRNARLVGSWLRGLADTSGVPWQRVVNAGGAISRRSHAAHEGLQRVLLEREGVRFGAGGQIDLARYRWRPGLVVAAARPRRRRRAARPRRV